MKLSNLQLDKLKSATKNATDPTLRLLSNILGNNETNFPHNLLLTDSLVSSLCNTFAINSLVNFKLSKTQLS